MFSSNKKFDFRRNSKTWNKNFIKKMKVLKPCANALKMQKIKSN